MNRRRFIKSVAILGAGISVPLMTTDPFKAGYFVITRIVRGIEVDMVFDNAEQAFEESMTGDHIHIPWSSLAPDQPNDGEIKILGYNTPRGRSK